MLNELLIVDAQGHWLMSSKGVFPEGSESSGLDYFTHHRDDASSGIYIGPPIRSRSTGEWVITISRRYTDAEGQFAGAVVVALGVENFRSEEHTSELQSHLNLVCRLLLEKKKPRHRRSPSPSSRPLPPSPTRGASPTLP